MDTKLPVEPCAEANPPVPEMCENGAALQTQLYEKYGPRVYHLALRLLGNADDAQDVTQDVFVQVMRHLPEFRGEAALPTWLYRVAVNSALGFRRKRTVRDAHRIQGQSEQLLSDAQYLARVRHLDHEPMECALAHEQHQVIEAAVARLPEKYRDVYVLADLEELTSGEIAGMLGLGVSAVKSRLHRARSLMRDALAGYVGGDISAP